MSSPSVVITSSLTTKRYVGDILRPVVLLFLSLHLGLNFPNNYQLQNIWIAMNCFQACCKLPWPAILPNLSSKEQIFDHMKSNKNHLAILKFCPALGDNLAENFARQL
ncbi:hypothetical protein TNCV_1208581 [Trichonephila clavipes]|nr:hypothetical protein TNCV_1208581 [Trichonephila clavipes]